VTETSTPTPQEWQALLARVEEAYAQADQDRYMLERSLSVCSEEMTELYDDLHRRSEDALAQRADQLERSLALATAIQEGGMQGIMVTNNAGIITSMNRRFLELLRVPPELAVPNTSLEALLAHCISLSADPAALQASVDVFRSDRNVTSSDDIHFADGRVLDRFTGPLKSKDGTVEGRLWWFRDVTEERKLAAQRMVVTERMAAVGQLVASVAHEINNPLAAILGNIELVGEMLGDTTGRDDVGVALKDAREGLERIRVIARDLRTLARADDETRKPLDVNAVLDSALQTAQNQIRHRARVVRSLSPVPLVEANEARLHQVFLNLLVNAAQATPEGRADDHVIDVRTDVTSTGNVRIVVKDSGSGIQPEHMERIFDAFFSTKPIGVGTGLGLSIVKGIINRLKGTIQVESQVGRGTAFIVELPPCERAKSAAPAEAPRAPPVRPRKILVVDDDELSRRWLARVLSRENDVTAAGGVDEAIRILETQTFDVIFCDVMMPHRTGRDLYVHLERNAPSDFQRLVLMTGGAFTEAMGTFVETATTAKLEKPISMSALRDIIETFEPRKAS
jgi:signal transduction histidine kinase